MAVLKRRSRRGYLLMDALCALFVVGAAVSLLAAAASIHHRAAVRLADQRRAMDAAESVLSDLQCGREPSKDDARIVQLDDAAPHGYRWVRVEVRHQRGVISLVGLEEVTP